MASSIDLSRSTMVAFYGSKPANLDQTLRAIQDAASFALNTGFRARMIDDVHATLIGLDQKVGNGVTPNLAQATRHMFDVLTTERVVLQFGGFSQDERTITSRGRSLHDRTLSVIDGQLVLIGWPVSEKSGGRIPTMRLADLRREFEQYGFRHKYHTNGLGSDPDAYLVLGEVYDADELNAETVAHIVRAGGLLDPVLVDLTPECVSVVQYQETSLPHSSSRWWSLSSAGMATTD